jgi:molybdenum cofactor cytidylyltransferase
MGSVSAILLAAGESRRMGDRNKLELMVYGLPLVRRTAHTLLASRLVEVVVVLGHESDRIRHLLEGLSLAFVENAYYREGQMTSVHAGLAALSRPCDGFMVCLADQPLLEAGDVDGLIRAFDERSRGSVLVPTFEGRRGNPVILACAHRETILASNRRLGCRRFIDENPELVETVEWQNDHVVFDLDTPEDYRELVRRVGAVPPLQR